MLKNLNRAIKKHWQRLQEDCKFIVFKKMPIIVYKRNKNLKEHLAKTKIYKRETFEKEPLLSTTLAKNR